MLAESGEFGGGGSPGALRVERTPHFARSFWLLPKMFGQIYGLKLADDVQSDTNYFLGETAVYASVRLWENVRVYKLWPSLCFWAKRARRVNGVILVIWRHSPPL